MCLRLNEWTGQFETVYILGQFKILIFSYGSETGKLKNLFKNSMQVDPQMPQVTTVSKSILISFLLHKYLTHETVF